MKTPFFIFSAFLILTLLSSCNNEESQIIAKKIQYDVNIKSPHPDYDWWIQNLPGPEREVLVEMIIEGAKSGKFQAYDYFNEPITKFDVRSILSDTIIMSLAKTEPPYEIYDTSVIKTVVKEDIQRLRFMEEWKINPDNLKIEKRVMAIAPIAKRIDLTGVERWMPLFWVYTDDNYLKGK
jgi:hypothetical protein